MDKQNTKDKIFLASVDLFSEKGFNCVSMRDIADKVGIKASSLYNHYKGKNEILNSIFDFFKEKMEKFQFNETDIENIINEYTPEQILKMDVDIFMEHLANPFIEKIAKIISMEQFTNEEARHFFITVLIEAPLQFYEKMFKIMMDKNLIKRFDTKILAIEYHSYSVYLYYEYNILRKEKVEYDVIKNKIRDHIDFFCKIIKKE